MSERHLIPQGLSVALMLICAETASALTSVVLVRTAKEIGIAADSERLVMAAGGTSANEICEIRRVGHITSRSPVSSRTAAPDLTPNVLQQTQHERRQASRTPRMRFKRQSRLIWRRP